MVRLLLRTSGRDTPRTTVSVPAPNVAVTPRDVEELKLAGGMRNGVDNSGSAADCYDDTDRRYRRSLQRNSMVGRD